MTPEILAYLQRSVSALSSDLSPQDQIKVLKTMSQMTAAAASSIELQLELSEDISNA